MDLQIADTLSEHAILDARARCLYSTLTSTLMRRAQAANLSRRRVGSRSLYHLAKSRWEIENQGFNDAKNQHGLEHICHHYPNSLLITWLVTMWALTIERLYRLRYLHRGSHPLRSAIDLVRCLWLSLSRPCPNTS